MLTQLLCSLQHVCFLYLATPPGPNPHTLPLLSCKDWEGSSCLGHKERTSTPWDLRARGVREGSAGWGGQRRQLAGGGEPLSSQTWSSSPPPFLHPSPVLQKLGLILACSNCMSPLGQSQWTVVIQPTLTTMKKIAAYLENKAPSTHLFFLDYCSKSKISE